MDNWKKKYKSLKDYYLNQYDSEFYSIDNYQLEIDPNETIDDVSAYNQQRQEEEIAKQNILFMAKSEAFDMAIIRDSSYTDLKSNLRKASTLMEVHSYAGAIVALETLKAQST
jgi:hypothetical protein